MNFLPSLTTVSTFFKRIASVAITLLLTNSLWTLPVQAQTAPPVVAPPQTEEAQSATEQSS